MIQTKNSLTTQIKCKLKYLSIIFLISEKEMYFVFPLSTWLRSRHVQSRSRENRPAFSLVYPNCAEFCGKNVLKLRDWRISCKTMRVVIGGGSGFVGCELARLLKSRGHEITIISRQPGPGKLTWAELQSRGLPPCEGVVNLAGENIMNPLRWWNESYKRDMYSSRINTTRMFAQAIAASSAPPHSWVLVTGVACYKPSLQTHYTEDSEWTPFDFLSGLVKEWEKAGRLSESIAHKSRQVIIRPGAVLGREGGAMKQMMLPFWLGLGGPLGSGRQPFPWIHVSDLAGLILHALEPSEEPPSTQPLIFNAVAPALNSNFEFTKELGRILKRPTILPVPGFFLDAFLGSERAVILTQGQKVVPKRTLESGFTFKYPDLSSALKEIVGLE